MAHLATLKRTVTRQECHWLDRDFVKGETVFTFHGCTYGCISADGEAFTLDPFGNNPFFELPADAVEVANG